MRIIVLLVTLLVATSVYAQDAAATLVPQDSWLHPLWEYLKPAAAVFLTTMASAIAALLVGYLVQLFRRAGIELSEADRQRYHDAAENAIKAAISKWVGPIPNMMTGPVPEAIVASAKEYLRVNNPETSKNLTDRQMTDIILSKVPQVAAVVTAAQTGSGTGTVQVADVATAKS